jgi:ubiquinone/menaquinone biosynthesis C-methylase UbiE
VTERQRVVFLEIYSDHQREGPGSPQSTQKAYSLITNLPDHPKILDVGCGSGAQTLQLAEISAGEITAVDNHRPFIARLDVKVQQKGLAKRVIPTVADMNQLPFNKGSFDLIWAEGSIYLMGTGNGLLKWHPLLKNKGSVAYTEITWTRQDVPIHTNGAFLASRQ